MKRSLKATILVILALGAGGIGATSAQAEPLFEADSYVATVDGTALASTVFQFGGAYQWECLSSSLQGSLAAKSKALTLSPAFAECRWWWPVTEPPQPFSAVTVSMNGCDFRLHTLKFQKADEYTSLLDLECPANKDVVMELKQQSQVICKLTVSAQSGKSDVRLIDKTKEGVLDDVEAQVTISGLKYSQELSNIFFPCPVKKGTYEDLEYKAIATLTATSEAGKQIGFRVTGE